jgi:arylformamidase
MAGWRGVERASLAVEVLDIDHGVPGGTISATYLSTPAHAGTHVDAARHFFPDGKTIDAYETDRFVCRATVLDFRTDEPRAITAHEIAEVDPGIAPGDGVLFSFGFAERYEDDSYYMHPYLSADAADYLVSKRVNVVGVDTLTPDCPQALRPPRFDYPVHARLLGADILIIENLGSGIASLLGQWFTIAFPPLRLQAADASPVAPLALIL